MQTLEYRERTATFNPDGSVELYIAWKRDYDSCLARLASQGVAATTVELNPGYLITLPADGVLRFPMLIKKRRQPTEADRERGRALALANPLHAQAVGAPSEKEQEDACSMPAA